MLKKIIFSAMLLFTVVSFSQQGNYGAYKQLTPIGSTASQTPSCNDLKNFIVKNGYYKSSVSSYTMDSSWLIKVTAYDYEYKTYVIAEIKTSQYDYKGKEYVFCGIPTSNWSNFKNGGYGDSDSYGKRFHKYIMNNKCNCS